MNAHDVLCRICHASVGRGCSYPDGTLLDPEFVHSVRAFDALVVKERMVEQLREMRVPTPRDSEREPFFGGFTR